MGRLLHRKKEIASERLRWKKKAIVLGLLAVVLVMTSCTVRYSFSGASVDYTKSKTFSVAYFNNMAAMVSPILSPTFTDELTKRMVTQTRLTQVKEEGDLSFSGEITNYTSDPVAVSGDEYAIKNRLTISVRVTFINKAQPQFSFTNRTFTEYEDYDTSLLLTTAEQTLIPQIVEKLVDNIFNAALSNW